MPRWWVHTPVELQPFEWGCIVGCKVQMNIKIDTLCEQWWLPEQHTGKKSGHMLHLLCHQGPMETVCLQQDSNHMYLWLGYYLHRNIAKHGYSGVVKDSTREWNGTLLSSVMRVGPVCMRVMDKHVYSSAGNRRRFSDEWIRPPDVTTSSLTANWFLTQ